MWTTHAVQGKIFWDLKLKENGFYAAESWNEANDLGEVINIVRLTD